MLLYFDLDSKQLINGPGFSGIVKSISFVRGDHETLEVRFLRAGIPVTDVTNIVFVIKEAPGTESPALAIANTWENPEGEQYLTATLNLNTEALDTLLGESRSKSLLAEITCHQGGTGPITSQLVTATVTGDLWRGDETTPSALPDPYDVWLSNTPQTWTTEEKAQARANIGAVASHTHSELYNPAGTVALVRVGVDYTGTGGSNTGVEHGDNTTASGESSHAEGSDTTASGESSHAEGSGTTASGYSSHAEGSVTMASGYSSHAEGSFTTASGYCSHSAGLSSVASGNYSRATGRLAKAIHDGANVETDFQNTDCESTAANQKTFRFENGYRFLGGAADFQTPPTVGGSALALASGTVPTTRTINGYDLSNNRTLTASDVGAATAAQGALADSALQPGDVSSPAPLSPVTSIELAAHQTKTASNQQLTIWTLGDSMMSDTRLPYGLGWILQYKTPIIGYALESILTQVVSGTVVEPPANATGSQRQDLWDTGKVWQMSSGAIIRAINGNGSTVGLYGSKANFYCLKQPSGGTATIEYSRDGGSTWASLGTLDTNGTAGELARAALTPAAGFGHYIYRVTATGGPVNYIGCKVWDDTRSGVILCNSNMGGITINSTLSAPAAVRNTIAADLGKIILISQFREGTGELTNTILGNFLDAWETAIPNGEIILVDQCDTPSLTGNEFTASVNGWYRTQAAARTRVRNYDINSAMGSEAERDARGFYNASARGTVTVNTTTNVLTCSAAHSFSVGGEITFSTTGTLPAPLQPWTMENPKRYFVKTTPTSTTFTISETNGGAEVDLTDSGSGTHTVWQTDTIHMSDDAWRFVGADLAMKLINFANGTCPAPVYRDGSGAREAVFGGLAEEYMPGNYMFRMPRAGRGRWGVSSKTNLGGIYRMGFACQAHNATFADGVIFELANDGGYKTPWTIDGSGYSYWGPYAATTNSGYTIGARAVVEEDANGKSVIAGFHKGTPTVPLMRLGVNASGTRTDKFQAWADGKISQFPPASATPATNGELVVEATSNTTLTFKLKGSDGTVRTGTITLA